MTTIVDIEARRVALRRTQFELCREANIDPSTYTKLKQDVERQPRPRTLRKLLNALNRFADGEAS